MEGLAHADLVIAVSRFSADCLRDFWDGRGVAGPPVVTMPLPAEVPGQPRVVEVKPLAPGPLQVLCVATLEPRKNHATLLAAFECAAVDAVLHLAGAAYAGAPGIAQEVAAAARRNPRICWHGSLEPAAVGRLYLASDFTVYPSFLEGFGLPVLESLWFGKPCVCADCGVMAENARGGGCVTVGVQDAQRLAEALRRLATDAGLRERLAREAVARPLRTWRGYADEVRDALLARA